MGSAKLKVTKKKRFWILLGVFVLLIALRTMLPYFVKNYINNVLSDIPGYYGKVDDIDISLIRGAYIIEGLYLNRVNADTEIPFLKFEKTDISIEWKSLFKGKIVSEIIMNSPSITYVFEDHKNSSDENTEAEDWNEALTDLVPININTLQIIGGKAAFVQVSTDPTIDLHFDKISLTATNLRNVVRNGNELPSTIDIKATSIGKGSATINGKMDLIKSIPDVDLSFSLEQVEVSALKDFTNHYAAIDFNEGVFNVYSEIVIADGFLKGYIKPSIQNAKLLGKEDGFFNKMWEGFVGFFKFILKNQNKNTIATKVPLEGNLNAVESKVWPTIGNIFKNAWIKAFENKVDHEIEFEEIQKSEKNSKS